MIVNVPVDDNFDNLGKQLQATAEELLHKLPIEDENILIEANYELLDPNADNRKFYLITDGNVTVKFGDRILYYYEKGEIIGFDQTLELNNINLKLDFAIRANIYNYDKVMKKIRKDAKRFELLMEYSSTHTSMLNLIVGASMAASKRPSFQIKQYEPGQDIITQGETDTDVYNMLSGRAVVMVDGTKVGEIGQEEVFGEMSRLTGEPRSATVQAEVKCEVMVFGGDDFTSLAESNPAALRDIAKSLSERLASLNKEITKK